LLELPAPADLRGRVEVQLRQKSDAVCWSTTFSAPFKKQDDTNFLDKSD
jgi:hypothetical protein